MPEPTEQHEQDVEDATLAANEGTLEFERSLGYQLTEAERVWVVDTLYVIGRHLLEVHRS